MGEVRRRLTVFVQKEIDNAPQMNDDTQKFAEFQTDLMIGLVDNIAILLTYLSPDYLELSKGVRILQDALYDTSEEFWKAKEKFIRDGLLK